jgi:hypothetical protein
MTLVLFLVFTASCSFQSTKKIQAKKNPDWKGQKVQILAISTVTGEHYQFAKAKPGKVAGNAVVGSVEPAQEIEIAESEIKNRSGSKTNVSVITMTDGKVYTDVGFKNGRYFRRQYRQISVPVGEVQLVTIRKTDPVKVALFTAGIALLAGLVVVAASSGSSGGGGGGGGGTESCPFLYSFDGQDHVFDAEPYGGATSEGLKRTEWCGLEHMKDVDGECRLLVTNEVDETQYTDILKLVVVDHPAGTTVVADETGHMHTITAPQSPLRAVDGKGRNVLPQVSVKDQRFWVTPTREKDPEDPAGLRDELVFEFPKPPGATRAKLLFNGCNTLWASQMLRNFLELYGQDVTKTYEAVRDPSGPIYKMQQTWNEREELYRLRIRVASGQGWTSKGMIVGGGPFASEDRVYALDLADVPGDILRIKLTPPAAFWMIDSLAVDYTEDVPVQVTEVGPARAVDGLGKDVRDLLADEDGRYLVMPDKGDKAEVTFKTPRSEGSLARSFVVKVGGYYDMHLEAKGPCQTELLRSFLLKPGSAVQYAFKRYLAAEQEALQAFPER